VGAPGLDMPQPLTKPANLIDAAATLSISYTLTTFRNRQSVKSRQ
jgi:hypothetical protein